MTDTPIDTPPTSEPPISGKPPVGEADVAAGLAEVLAGIARASEDCARDPAGIRLIAVSKTVPTEGILPAPESTHAICGAINEALKARQEGIARTILFGLSGHGNFDLAAYDSYLAGTLVDDSLDDAAVARGLASIPQLITA